jgi:hypothetical protein
MQNACKIGSLGIVFVLFITGCGNIGPTEPSGNLKHGEGRVTFFNTGDDTTFTFPGGDYGNFRLERYSEQRILISAPNGVIGVRDTSYAPESGYSNSEFFDLTDDEGYYLYYFMKTDSFPHYAKVKKTGVIAKKLTDTLTVIFEWWLNPDPRDRHF